VIAILLGAFLVAFFAIWAVAQGLSNPEVPSGDVAVVEDAPGGPVTKEEFDEALTQAAAAQGAPVPKEDNPQYDLLKDQAMSDALLARWVAGEAEELGIEATDTEVDQQLEQIKQQNFKDEQEFQQFLDESGFTQQEALERVRLTVLSQRLQEDAVKEAGEVSDADVEDFYDENASQFEQPEARDVRVILNQDEAAVDEARSKLEQDDSDESWDEVARQYSSDEASRTTGGLRSGVIEGQGDATFDEQVFSAPEGELIGPFETEEGFYLIQVDKVTEAKTTPLDEASEQIRQQLVSSQQQLAAQEFESDFIAKWTARTFCAEGYVMERCANAEPPPPTEGAPPVISSRPASPGQSGVVTPGLVTGGAPQGPYLAEEAAPALPPGAAPIGPTGAPTTGAPPTGAPPTGAPPTAP
jgi:foldase protein PrsA